eukprot:7806321-Ditylum_brightwellii.AAC.2
MVTFSKPLNAVKPQGNGLQELEPIIPIERPKVHKLTKGDYHVYKLHMVPYNTNLPTYNLAFPLFNIGSVEEWLMFQQSLQAVITRQNIADHQGMYAITKNMLHGDTLAAFKNAEGVNRPQSEPAYKKTMVDIHTHVPTMSLHYAN